MAIDLFNELLNTVLANDESRSDITYTTMYCEPALGHLSKIADFSTVNRCLNKLREERKALRDKS